MNSLYLIIFCSLMIIATVSFVSGKSPNTAIVDIANATEDNPVLLNCTLIDGGVYVWTYLSPQSEKPEVQTETNSTLKIVSPSAAGYYNCSAGKVLSKYQANNFSHPYIVSSGKSVIFAVDDTNKTIECISYSFPSPEFDWALKYPDETTVTLSDANSQIYSISNELRKSILTISRITEDVRATYFCTTKNEVDSATASVLLRVHGKLAALWPFLGIVCQILILISIMLIVRRKTETGQKDGTSSRSSSSSGHSQAVDETAVRFRKSAN